MIHDEFVKLVDSLPEWERDELRRFLQQGSLNPDDDVRTVALIKQALGVDPGVDALVGVPVSARDLETLTAGPSSYFLAGIEAKSGCSALNHGSKLPVDPGPGLQVYLGRNGAGKSSFVRLLRAAGSARLGIEVLPDVFGAANAPELAAAEFDVYVDGELQHVAWRQGLEDGSPLSVAVYDRDCSAVYLEGGNVAEYLPHGLDAFAVLADARKRLKLTLLEEARQLRERMPRVSEDLDSDTEVCQVLEGWDELATSRDRLDALARWDAADDARLRELEDLGTRVKDARVAYMKMAETIEKRRASAKSLNDASASLSQVRKAYDGSLATNLAKSQELLARAQADLDDAKARATQKSALDSLLTGTATAEWIALVQAAKAYSETHAYPESSFPATDPGCRCVLCQQPLDTGASQRLATFAIALKAATSSDSEQDPEVHRLALHITTLESERSTTLRSLDDAASRVRQLLRAEAVGSNADAVRCLNEVVPTVEAIADAARTGNVDDAQVTQLRSLIDRATDALDTAAVEAWTEVKALESKSADAPESFEEAELNELHARQWLRSNLPAMQKRVEAVRTARLLEDAASTLSITPVTNVSKRVAAELVTDRLIDELRSQLEQVGLGYLQAQVVSSGRAGVTTIRLAPPDKGFRKTDMSRVLSEGEQALMGLAAFLAELELAGHHGPVVLDDPVTGLDAQNKDLMAERLARLGADRQVLVMTHDEDFVQKLRDTSQHCGARFVERSVSRQGAIVGVVQ